MLHNFNKINFTSLKIQRRGGVEVLKNVAFQIEKKSGNIPGLGINIFKFWVWVLKFMGFGFGYKYF